jgi:hypothetical protein
VTAEERERIREAARRYVHERAPNPPDAVLERVARIVLEARIRSRRGMVVDHSALDRGQLGAA